MKPPRLHRRACSFASLALWAFACAEAVVAQVQIPQPDPPFTGRVDERYELSKPQWPSPPRAPAGAPNVLVFVLDDLGFAQLGAFGGVIETPNIDRIAANGLRYTQFNTTGVCSPTRAALLTGRNPHTVGMGSHSASAMGFPGYNGYVPRSAATFFRALQGSGYTTFGAGKWDHTPAIETTIAGPFDRWPSGQGFDHFYGFMAADTDQFRPTMWSDHTPIEPYLGKPDYILSRDLADKAIDWLTGMKSFAPDRPWALYWATGAAHAPHQASARWLQHYRGRFDGGWDQARDVILAKQKALGIVPPDTQLSARPAEIPAWDSLTAKQRKLYSRQMEAFAALVSEADHEFGRILDTLERTGQLDNTLIMVLSDNGASAEGDRSGSYNEYRFLNGVKTPDELNEKFLDRWGSEATFAHYSAGWAMAGNTPFRYYKQTVHPGGTRSPLIVSWPKGIAARGEVRDQFLHVIDIAPTVLEAARIPSPRRVDGIEQGPLEGAAFNATFDAAAARTRDSQYFEMYGHRAYYEDGWLAVTLHGQRMPWNVALRAPFDQDVWELYHLEGDFAGARDLAAQSPEKLAAMRASWDVAARAHGVYPLYDDFGGRIADVKRHFAPQGSREFFGPGAYFLVEALAPAVKNRSHTIDLELRVPPTGADGVLVAQSGSTGGYVLYVKDGRVTYEYNYLGEDRYRVESAAMLPSGPVRVQLKYFKGEDLSGRVEIWTNGAKVGEGVVPRTQGYSFSADQTFDVGLDTASPVSEAYEAPFPFTGTIDRAVITPVD